MLGKILLLISVLFSTIVFNTNAQESTSSSFNNPRNKWEIGLNTLSLFDMSQKVAPGLLIKRYTQTEKGGSAVRFKISPRIINASAPKGSANQRNLYSKNPGIFVALGYEWQKHYGRFTPYYGGEIFTSYNMFKASSGGIIGLKQTAFELGGSGFIGAKFYTTNHISFSVESHLLYTYYRLIQDGLSFTADNSQRSLVLHPIYAFYLNYHF